jgi:phosphopantothenoylcysteine decarboxylase/phosphopantothenate--cysteine ligase
VTGGIAAYKTVQLARDLTLLGAQVDVVMTAAARAFVGAVSYEGVTGRPVATALVAEGHALEHIRLAREADVVCVAPATADFLARAAAGRSDDLLCAVLLATRAPVLVCPAMNDAMWAHPQTRVNARRLVEIGYTIVGPATGPLAWSEGEGPGRMDDPSVIIEHVGRALEGDNPLRGRRVLVTAGPTREAVDAVRVLTNRSSGRMGFAVAAAAWRRGADVTLIAGPSEVPPPPGPRLVRVESAEQMADAVRDALPEAQLLVMTAAVADFRPADPVVHKIKKRDQPAGIALEAAPDVLGLTRTARPPGLVTVGFALETSDGRVNAREKLASKALDMIVLNPADRSDAGFEAATNRVVLIDREGGEEELPLLSKDDVAEVLLDRAARRLADHGD